MRKRLLSILLCLCVVVSLLAMTVSAAGQFKDVKDSDYFAAPVAWAVSQGITNGTSETTFSPDQTCTRAHIITFLWRAAGSPTDSGFMMNPYTDIKETDYYYYAALWAKAYGMVEGYKFEPNTACTRGSTVEYLWYYAMCPFVESIPFSDVKEGTYQDKAVSWALEMGITNGTGGTTFSPKKTVTRGQIVTFLHRYFVSPLDNSALIAELKGTSGGASGGETVTLDPLPPENYRKHAEWYGTLTPVGKMSNAKLVAESDSIAAVIADYKARDAFITDSIYIRRDDIRYQIMERAQIVKSYDDYVRYNADYGWEIPDYILEDYEDLVAKYGDPEPLRDN